MLSFVTLLLVLFQIASGLFDGDYPVITTNNGQIRGYRSTTVNFGIPYVAFRGIPYAEPPLGSLRFEPPVPKSNWDGVLDTINDGSVCLQLTPSMGSEDCLFLNVYVPDIQEISLPVMVFIYGGAYVMGSSNYQKYSPDYLLEKKVIFVSINYRLGIFGFLTTGDLVAPGNNGLKDQLLALKWIKNNIKYFGGDPEKVTLFGQSAGASSAAYHLLSPKSTGLFRGVILDSGTTLNSWSLCKIEKNITKTIAKLSFVDTTSSKTMVDGLKKVNSSRLITLSTALFLEFLNTQTPTDTLLYGPVQEPEHDDAFFTYKSHTALKSGNFTKVPILMGFNSLEAAFLDNFFFDLYAERYDRNVGLLTPAVLNIKDFEKRKEIGLLIRREYCTDSIPLMLQDPQIMEFLTDDVFVRPIREFAYLASKYTDVYFYEFSYKGNVSDYCHKSYKTVHTEELQYLFVNGNNEYHGSDMVTRERMTTLWTNFVKYGNPVPIPQNGTLQKLFWPPFNQNFTYLRIDNYLHVLKEPKMRRMNFWYNIFNKYGNPPYDTF